MYIGTDLEAKQCLMCPLTVASPRTPCAIPGGIAAACADACGAVGSARLILVQAVRQA